MAIRELLGEALPGDMDTAAYRSTYRRRATARAWMVLRILRYEATALNAIYSHAEHGTKEHALSAIPCEHGWQEEITALSAIQSMRSTVGERRVPQ
jgi:hypothetical protein